MHVVKRRWRLAGTAILAIAVPLAGCYSSVPVVGNTVPAGEIVILSINDAGRAAYAERMGPEIDRLEGRLVQRDSASYTLSMRQVELLRGGTQVWSGERISIRAEHVTSVAARRLAKGRTAAVSAAVVGAVTLIARASLSGVIAGDEGRLPSDTLRTVRLPWP